MSDKFWIFIEIKSKIVMSFANFCATNSKSCLNCTLLWCHLCQTLSQASTHDAIYLCQFWTNTFLSCFFPHICQLCSKTRCSNVDSKLFHFRWTCGSIICRTVRRHKQTMRSLCGPNLRGLSMRVDWSFGRISCGRRTLGGRVKGKELRMSLGFTIDYWRHQHRVTRLISKSKFIFVCP